MKKTFFIILFIIPFIAKAQQYTAFELGPSIAPAGNYIYLGSLNFTSDNAANSQKLQVDIIGGDWGAPTSGTTTFYIANRGGLLVNQVTSGGNALGGSSLVIYQNGGNTDFYLTVNSSVNYYSLAVRSYLFGYSTTAQWVSNTMQTAVPTGTNITSTVTVNPLLIMDGSGNVGINTSTFPDYKFAINGSAIATSFTVKTYPTWSDYVFNPDYQLPALNTIKSYIDQNHHLPEIPSAAEVAKNGINLGKMDELFMKKIEELTLYLIDKDEVERDQKKEIKQLSEQLQNAKAQLQTQAERLEKLEKALSK